MSGGAYFDEYASNLIEFTRSVVKIYFSQVEVDSLFLECVVV